MLAAIVCCWGLTATAQTDKGTLQSVLSSYISTYVNPATPSVSKNMKLERVDVNQGDSVISVYGNEFFQHQAFTQQVCDTIYAQLQRLMPAQYSGYGIKVYAGGRAIEELIPFRPDTIPGVQLTWRGTEHKGQPWVSHASRPWKADRGLQDRQITVWQSHGNYYDPTEKRWRWQRPNLFLSPEDLLTQTFVVPYIIPMLENAGANVFTPRERDWQRNEVIVDNDHPHKHGRYTEEGDDETWRQGAVGFAHEREVYNTENPFREGTFRMAETTANADEAKYVTWTPHIDAAGRYAVYVSYATVNGSIDDATYIICHRGIETRVKVNQQMGGSTWVYLGQYEFGAGGPDHNYVKLSNYSEHGGVVTADAVRFGGGMGNIMRGGSISGKPRYLEAARYNAQWAGMPENVYHDRNTDYNDDIAVRALYSNYLSGGSAYQPGNGLKVPTELSVAFHSDAGYTTGDTIVGCLGIYTEEHFPEAERTLPGGVHRSSLRSLAEALMTQTTADMKHIFGQYNRRNLFNRNYGESRTPEVPSVIFEMLSHQNWADMKLAHDPNFKFHFSRAIYKGILRYEQYMHGWDQVVIQPLPVTGMQAIVQPEQKQVTVRWNATRDELEDTAQPRAYILYMARGDQGYDNGTVVHDTQCTMNMEPGVMYRFKVRAMNEGGVSMPGEEVCAYLSRHGNAHRMLLVNGFQRVAAPYPFDNATNRGFDMREDPGVADVHTPEYCGNQIYTSKAGYAREDATGMGFSGSELEGVLVAGNTHDWPTVHARDILSEYENITLSTASRSAAESAGFDATPYQAMDIIMGAQRQDGYSPVQYKTFTPAMKQLISGFLDRGGAVMVSGAYVASDMTDEADSTFMHDRLHVMANGLEYSTDMLEVKRGSRESQICMHPNELTYSTGHVDALAAASEDAEVVMHYTQSQKAAAVAWTGQGGVGRTYTLGFPIECITDHGQRRRMMTHIMDYLLK